MTQNFSAATAAMYLGAQPYNNVTQREMGDMNEIITRQEERIHNLATKAIQDMKEIIKRQEERIHNLETKAIQLINLYFVFQGVILSSTSSASNLKCRHWRIPFVLSLFATLLNGFAFFVTIYAILRARDELDVNEAKLVVMKHQVRVNNPEQAAADQGQPHEASGENNNQPKPDGMKKGLRSTFALVASGLFVGFSVVVLIGCVQLLCHK